VGVGTGSASDGRPVASRGDRRYHRRDTRWPPLHIEVDYFAGDDAYRDRGRCAQPGTPGSGPPARPQGGAQRAQGTTAHRPVRPGPHDRDGTPAEEWPVVRDAGCSAPHATSGTRSPAKKRQRAHGSGDIRRC